MRDKVSSTVRVSCISLTFTNIEILQLPLYTYFLQTEKSDIAKLSIFDIQIAAVNKLFRLIKCFLFSAIYCDARNYLVYKILL